jgi:hypothetical protein
MLVLGSMLLLISIIWLFALRVVVVGREEQVVSLLRVWVECLRWFLLNLHLFSREEAHGWLPLSLLSRLVRHKKCRRGLHGRLIVVRLLLLLS